MFQSYRNQSVDLQRKSICMSISFSKSSKTYLTGNPETDEIDLMSVSQTKNTKVDTLYLITSSHYEEV